MRRWSTCIPRSASAMRWATSSRPTRISTPLVITAGQQARPILPYEPFLYAERPTDCRRRTSNVADEPARAADVPLAVARLPHRAEPPCGPTFVSIPGGRLGQPVEPVRPPLFCCMHFAPTPPRSSEIGRRPRRARGRRLVVGAARRLAVARGTRRRPRREAIRRSVWARPMSAR